PARRLEGPGGPAGRPPLGLRRVRRPARLPAAAALLGAEVVERRIVRDVAEPRARRGPPRVEAPPRAEGLLEGVAGEILGDGAVSGHEQQVAVDGVEVLLRDRGEARPAARANAYPRRPGAHRRVHTPSTPLPSDPSQTLDSDAPHPLRRRRDASSQPRPAPRRGDDAG